MAKALACKERIANDIYSFYGAFTPRIELSKQKMTNTGFPKYENAELVHTMVELIPGFKTYKDFCGQRFTPSCPNPNRQLVSADGKEVLPERGLGQILAVAVLINDIDVIGGTGGNIGFQTMVDTDGSKYARTIKIDPGEAFNKDESLGSERAIRVATSGISERLRLHYDTLPIETQHEFLITMDKILDTTRAAFEGFFLRPGAHHFITLFNWNVEDLANFLVKRQAKLRAEYSTAIDTLRKNMPALFATSEKVEHFEDAFNQSKARENEILAAQEELYFYVDPDVLDGDRLTALSVKIDEFIAFDKGDFNTVMLIKGESGSGKSLTVRSLEQKLLNKKREDRNAPMPIYIDLKQFTNANVAQSFWNTLKEKYSDEYDPKKNRLIVLMDGYDEIAGGCQQNLYDIQQLERYSHNIRVIITCRSQYLTVGYHRWFKPSEGRLKELEIQPFSNRQIEQYLQRYSAEAAKVHRRSYTVEEYQHKITALPNLKEIITNPFILRLVAESLPRLEDYLSSKQNQSPHRRSEPGRVILNRYAIYKCFMEHWFAKQERKLIDSGMMSSNWQAIEAFLDYSRRVALRLHSKKEIQIKVREDRFWQIYFDNTSPEMTRARSGCPLRRQDDYQYSFIHKSFLEYFVANGILDMIANENSLLSGAVNLTPDMIIQDQGVLEFFQDAFELDSKLKGKCLVRIFESRIVTPMDDEQIFQDQTAATAAIASTLLNAINYDIFSGMDLSNIRIPMANLSHGVFEGTDFTGADLTKVNFASTWLKDANFTKTNLTGANFGEWPFLQFEAPISDISFSQNGSVLAAAIGKEVAIFERDPKLGRIRELKKIKANHSVECCILSPDGERVLLHLDNQTICIWDICSNKLILELQGSKHIESVHVNDYDFSPDGKKFVSKGQADDNSLYVWDVATTGLPTHVFRGHHDRITTCKFSPDGKQIFSGSLDKTMRVWDVASGLSTHKNPKKSTTKEGLNLSGVNIVDAIGLSDTNIALLYQRGGQGFTQKEAQTFLNNIKDIVGSQDIHGVRLDFSSKAINVEIACGMAQYTAWINLQILDLSRNLIGNKGVIGLGTNQTWRNLRVLMLAENEIEDEGARGLSKNRSWKNLEELNLMNNMISDEGARVLSANVEWKKMKKMSLKGNNLANISEMLQAYNKKYSLELIEFARSYSGMDKESDIRSWIQEMHSQFEEVFSQYNDERHQELKKLWKSRRQGILTRGNLRKEGFFNRSGENDEHLIWMANIKTLNLTKLHLGDQEVESLCRNMLLSEIMELILAENPIGSEGAQCLSNVENWKNLQILDLHETSIGDKGVAELSKNASWINLQTLNLAQSKIGTQGAAELSRNTAWTNLKELLLQHNKIGGEGAAALSKNASWINLHFLDLSDTNIDEHGAVELGKNLSWTQLQTLNLSRNKIGDKGAQELSKNTAWTKLQALYLSENSIGYFGGVELCKNIAWTNLQVLDLNLNKIDVGGARELARNSCLTQLRELNLLRNDIGAEGASELSSSSSLADLQTLALSENDLGNKGVAVLSKNSTWKNLQALNLTLNKISSEGAEELSKNTAWVNLRVLNLTCNSIRDKGALRLSENTTWVNLQTLILTRIEIGVEGVRGLSKNTTWRNLQTLTLLHNRIDNEGAAELSKNTAWVNLQELNVAENYIGDKGAAELGGNTTWVDLQTLNLTSNKIGGDGAAELGKNSAWTNLQVLLLGQNKIDAKGAIELGKNTAWANLEELNLSKNDIRDKGASGLAKNEAWVNLQTLDLAGNKIEGEGAVELGKNKAWSNLQTLNLSKNDIRDRGAVGLARSMVWENLQVLDLNTNKIGAEGASELSKNKTWMNLQTLNLSYNVIEDKGAAELARNTVWTELETLDLSSNGISDQGALELSQNTTWTNLHTFKLEKNNVKAQSLKNAGKFISYITGGIPLLIASLPSK